MSSLSDLISAIERKVLETDPDVSEISWAEEFDPFEPGITRPKIVIDVPKFRSSGYVSQRTMEWNFYISVTGYLRKIIPDGQLFTKWEREDRLAINDWAFATVNRIYSLHDDKQADSLTVNGFQQFSGEAECWVDLELIPGQAVFKLNLVAIVQLADTEA